MFTMLKRSIALMVALTTFTAMLSAQVHFETIWDNNGVDHMNFYVMGATINDEAMETGDEIAVFDGNLCVGVGVWDTAVFGTNGYITFVASRDDGTGNGYTQNNPVIYKAWDTSAQQEIANDGIVVSYSAGGGEFVAGESAIFTLAATFVDEEYFPEYSITFNVADGLGANYDLTTGFSVNATDGYDEGIDLYAPPAPPAPSFDAAINWSGDRYYAQILASDGDLSEHEIPIALQYSESGEVTFSWDNTGWQYFGDFTLIDPFGGAIVNVNMLEATSVVIDNTALTTVYILMTPSGVAPPEAPSAYFLASPTEGFTPITINFTEASSAGSADITSYMWSFGDGTSFDGQNPGSHEYTAAGSYLVSLTVFDANDLYDTYSTTINVSDYIAPTALFSAGVTAGSSPLTVNFEDESEAGSGELASWDWDFGDGTTGDVQNPSHVYTEIGTYSVSLTVTDQYSVTAYFEEIDFVTVTAEPLWAPTDLEAYTYQTGSESNVGLDWVAPVDPSFIELAYDDGTAEAWYWVGTATGVEHMATGYTYSTDFNLNQVKFYIRSNNMTTQDITFNIFGDNNGMPNLNSNLGTFTVNFVPEEDPTWITIDTDIAFSAGDVFYLDCQWNNGNDYSIGSDDSAPDGFGFWTNDNGASWNQWTAHDFMMHAIITGEGGRNVELEGNVTFESQASDGELADMQNLEKVYVAQPNANIAEEMMDSFNFHITTRDFLYYNIYRDGANVGNTADEHFDDLGVADGTYDYQVKALYEGGESAGTNVVSVNVAWQDLVNARVFIQLDNYPGETTWDMVNDAGTMVANGGPYTEGGGIVDETFGVAPGFYTFTIYDAWGDGICCAYGEGYYQIFNADTDEMLVDGNGDFGDMATDTFEIAPNDFGHISGVVSDQNGSAVEGVVVTISESGRFDVTGTDGAYAIDEHPGDYNMTAVKLGYIDGSATVTVVEGEDVIVDISIAQFETVTVLGTVLGYNGPTVSGAMVTLNGYDNYQTTTDASGAFVINGVYANNTYDFVVSIPDYGPYTETITIGDVDYDFGDVVLPQQDMYPPSNLQYTETMPNNVHLTWDAPVDPNAMFIGYDDGENFDGIGTGGALVWASIRWDAGDLAAYDGMYLTSVNFFPREVSTATIYVWTGANASTMVLEQATNVTADTWNNIALDTPVAINSSEELWIGYSAEGAYPLGCDAGPAVAGYGDMISLDGSTWESMANVYGLDYNWNMQCALSTGLTFGSDFVEIPMIPGNEVTTISDQLVAKEDVPVRLGFLEEPENTSVQTRDLDYYIIYRDGAEYDVAFETSFNDMDVPDGIYEYNITAMYWDGESDPTNTVEVEVGYTLATQARVFIQLDQYPGETTWDMVNDAGTMVANGGPYSEQMGIVDETFDVAPGLYTFTIYDAFGDGICCAYGEGYYQIFNAATDEMLVDGNGAFGDMATHTIEFALNDYGFISGVVTDLNGTAVQDVVVTVTETGKFDVTGTDGAYAIDEHPGDYNLTAVKLGYVDGSATVTVVEGEDVTADFALEQFETVSVLGSIVGYDGETISGGTVTLNGYDNYQTTTDASGTFVINGVYANNTYDLSISYSGYGDYTETINVESVDYDLGDLILPAQPLDPPANLQYTETMPNNVHLTWDAPVDPNAAFIGYDNGENNDGIGTGGALVWASIRWDAGDLSAYDGMYLTTLDFFPREVSTATIYVWTGANASTMVLEQATDVTADAWNSIALDTPVEINSSEELWIGYSANGAYPLGCDAGPAVAGYGDMVSLDGATWESMANAYGLDYNWNMQGALSTSLVRGVDAIEIPLIAGDEVTTISTELVAKEDIPVALGFLGAVANTPSRERPVDYYVVYRDGSEYDVAFETSFNDMDVPDGLYEYFVTAMYWDGESAPTNTVVVDVDYEEAVNVNVFIQLDGYPGETTWDIATPDGSIVANGGPYTDVDGIVDEIYQVAPGDYFFTIYDAYGDGICCAYGEGYYQIFNADSEELLIDGNGDFGDVATTPFSLGPNDLGYVTGIVYDVAGAPIQGAQVTIVETGTFDLTGEDGTYEISESEGVYTLLATGDGYVDVTVEDVEIAMDQTITVDFEMTIDNSLDWEIFPEDWAYSGSFTSIIFIDNVESIDMNDQLGAFVDGELRGVAKLAYGNVLDYYEALGHYYFLPMVYSNQASGETLTFKVYDASANDVFDVTETYEFTANMVVGDFMTPFEFHAVTSAIDETPIPTEFTLGNAYPNPFNPVTTIEFSVPELTNVKIDIYNILGQVVNTLVNVNYQPGFYSVQWDGTDTAGHGLPNGIYLYSVRAGSFTSVKKLTLMK
jgi:PKD repeat protein